VGTKLSCSHNSIGGNWGDAADAGVPTNTAEKKKQIAKQIAKHFLIKFTNPSQLNWFRIMYNSQKSHITMHDNFDGYVEYT